MDTILSSQEVSQTANNGYATYSIRVPADSSYPATDSYSKPPSTFVWCSHFLSLVTTCCCWCCLCIPSTCGLTGLLFAIGSYTDYKTGDYDRYKYKRSCSYGWTVTGFVVGTLFLAGAAFAGYKYWPNIVQFIGDFLSSLTG